MSRSHLKISPPFTMNIRLATSPLIILLFLLNSCSGSRGKDLNHCPIRLLSFSELPQEVQKVYLNNWKLNIYYEDPEFIVNLDSAEYTIEYENTAITQIRPGAQNFKIGKKEFYLPWNSNKEVCPYVFYKKKLYIIYARNTDEMNVFSIEELYDLQYKEFDLNQEL